MRRDISRPCERMKFPMAFVLGVLCFALMPEPARACDHGDRVGYALLPLPTGRSAAVWYPTASQESSVQYWPGFSSHLAVNGQVAACELLPLLVFSHGSGGCGTQSIFVTETLARAGFIVAAPDHADATCSVTGQAPPSPRFDLAPLFNPTTWNGLSYIDRAIAPWPIQPTAVISRTRSKKARLRSVSIPQLTGGL